MCKLILAWALTATAVLAQAPSGLTISPATGQGLQASLTISVTDPNGTEDLQAIRILIQHEMNGEKACYVVHYPGEATAFLRNDTDSQWGPAVPLGVAGTDSNSQCGIVGQESSATVLRGVYNLKLHLHFKSSFAGVRRIWVQAVDKSGLGASRWILAGNWIVPEEPVAGGTIPVTSGLDTRPERGSVWTAGRVVLLGADGKLQTAGGSAADCLRADGTSAVCSGASLAPRIERIKIPEAVPTALSMASDPVTPEATKVYRNGLLLAPEEDYVLSGKIVTFVRPVRAADIVQVEYWVSRAP